MSSVAPLISVLLPTRKRPESLMRMLSSMFGTADEPTEIEVVVYIDDDDSFSQQLDFGIWNVKRVVGPRQTMGRLNSICYGQSTGEIVMLGNDDVIVQTRGWDTKIRIEHANFADEVYLMYPNDMHKGGKLSTFPIVSRLTCDTVGDPFPADYRGAFIDVHLMDIFKQLEGYGHRRVRYLEHIVFEHMHYKLGKSVFDETYRQRERFGDDYTFVVLNDARGWAVKRLHALIVGNESTPAERLKSSRPAGGWFLSLTWDFLQGGSSPMGWRLRVFVWLWLRFLYKKVFSKSSSIHQST